MFLKDHPRTRGEKFPVIFNCFCKKGSPPHTRGKDNILVGTEYSNRITPAHAGKSQFLNIMFSLFWDHPRTRGEKCYACCFRIIPTGSPPHTRGKEIIITIIHKKKGITPAHAGKRKRIFLHNISCWDHPRTRGEKFPLHF